MKKIFAVVLISFGLGGCSDVAFVDRVTVVNNTEYSAEVDVSDADRDSWLGLGRSLPGSEQTFEQVIDQGDVWAFSFDYVGRHQEDIEVSRADMERNDWRVEIPQSFEDRLRDLGVPPPA